MFKKTTLFLGFLALLIGTVACQPLCNAGFKSYCETGTPAPEELEEDEAEAESSKDTATAPTHQTTWAQIKIARYSEMVQVGDELWEIPLGTAYASTTKNGRYEAVASAPAGVVGETDYGWCGQAQYDCPPHALLVRMEAPLDKLPCLSGGMEISWRIAIKNDCETPVQVRIFVRHNDQTLESLEQLEAYLALAGVEELVLRVNSEVGLFVSVRESGTDTLLYEGREIAYGYSCWDCLANTRGAGEPAPIVLSGKNFSTFGRDTTPAGSALLPGVVFPLPRPATEGAFSLSFELEVEDETVIWAGRYDALPPTATPRP